MSIEILSLTDKGMALSHSVRRSNDVGWKVIYFLSRLGGKATHEKICSYCFGGNVTETNVVLRNLKAKGIVE